MMARLELTTLFQKAVLLDPQVLRRCRGNITALDAGQALVLAFGGEDVELIQIINVSTDGRPGHSRTPEWRRTRKKQRSGDLETGPLSRRLSSVVSGSQRDAAVCRLNIRPDKALADSLILGPSVGSC